MNLRIVDLKASCVSKVKFHLDQHGLKSKTTMSVAGKRSAGIYSPAFVGAFYLRVWVTAGPVKI
jgi:hypothetical protein